MASSGALEVPKRRNADGHNVTITPAQLEDIGRRLDALEQIVTDLLRQNAADGLHLPNSLRAPVDPAADARLLSALALAFGSAVFSAGDVLRHAAHDSELRHALDGRGARRLGSWLRRLHRQPTDPYVLHRITRDGAGTIWRLDVDATDIHAVASGRVSDG